MEKIEIRAELKRLKLSFLLRNAEMYQIKIFYAFRLEMEIEFSELKMIFYCSVIPLISPFC